MSKKEIFEIGKRKLTGADAFEIISKNEIGLSHEAKERIARCRAFLEEKIERGQRPYYGINTGFGSLCDIQISKDDLNALQENLVKSHACGTGDMVPIEIVRLMLLLKIQSLSEGHSGVTNDLVNRLIDFFNAEITPVVFDTGSLGASGDLAPLAHLSLPLIGLGKVDYKEKVRSSDEVLKELGWDPLILKAKEGLALLNGTQFMGAYGIWCVNEAKKMIKLANLIAAFSIDGIMAGLEPFNSLIHAVRPFPGQQQVAKDILSYLEGSEIAALPKKQIQDPYSFRCIPQVHGASLDAINYVESVVEIDINAVTDNPIIFPDEDEIVSGGNFHGQQLAMAFDYLAIAVSELGSISERRTYKHLAGKRGLPEFLIAQPGLNSGLMIPQYTAAALCSKNKQLCTPASIDTISSSNGQEDHVSMGANAATKCYQVIENVKTILAIELLTATQSLEFRKPKKSSKKIEYILNEYREVVPFVENDKLMYEFIDESRVFLKNMVLDDM